MRILMWRENLEDVPEFGVPAGFGLRWHCPGDEAAWLRIDRLANPGDGTPPDLFDRVFGADLGLLARRQCYLLDGHGEPVGTATAWFDDDFEGARVGRIHYVAVVPEYQGRGLSRPLMTAVCGRLRELGHCCAYLATATHRIRAINLYRRFGFKPLIRNEAEADAWAGLCPSARSAATLCNP
ncbi:MAG TPA: GNAT family N-acetyltransferase [Candidatus Acidoferrum sp.]|nr:GNAT family N-acetyltransferase [Candidatus Acidoferrum sp.]